MTADVGEPELEERIRLATLAAVKRGARSDAEAVRNYREAERCIRAALPYLIARDVTANIGRTADPAGPSDDSKLVQRLGKLLPPALADQIAAEVLDSLWLAEHDQALREAVLAEQTEPDWEPVRKACKLDQCSLELLPDRTEGSSR
jgi:hypothetical protein